MPAGRPASSNTRSKPNHGFSSAPIKNSFSIRRRKKSGDGRWTNDKFDFKQGELQSLTRRTNPNPTLFHTGSAGEPYNHGQGGSALRATPQATVGDVTDGQGLQTTCTFPCPWFPALLASLTTSDVSYCRIRVSSEFSTTFSRTRATGFALHLRFSSCL